MRPGRARAAGLLLGVVADQVLGDPVRGHPVAGFGRVATALERRLHRDSIVAGGVHVALLAGGAVGLGVLTERVCRSGAGQVLATAAATWSVVGARTLVREGAAVAAVLDTGDLPAAQRQVGRLVGRDTTVLDPAGVARAAVESLAENSSDAAVAPLLWGGLFGVPGLLGYRAVNTLDAMIGHRSPRYLRFGRIAARLDDVVNWPAARLTACFAAGLAPLVGGAPAAAVRAWRRDAGAHPSPNAGPVEAAFAGALGRTLGGSNVYHGTVEDRGRLGEGPAPDAADLARAGLLVTLVTAAAAVLAVGISAGRSTTTPVHRRPSRSRAPWRARRVGSA
ncbi:cobalamin biosynthesis protein [Nakamurella sp. YIM 132087]|uniref:Cobalamin biosynthesis protein CobD n=1 Tax=Nakamurella alba TaxID=2665158 RepID=A0A7K1FG34_9ACTN|nr:cobalamin biosynthesis protein [Nakamurella alba]MTD13075.1 cobalamin biosynthesis protein [Nakamurella alba]